MTLPLPDDWGPMLRDVERAHPNEGCGVILKGPSGLRIHPMRNVYDELRASDPRRFSRSARTAYHFSPKEWLQVNLAAEAAGEEVACVYHSHVDVGSYFSDEDAAMAAPEGEPLLPGVQYLVLAVNSGKAQGARLFGWKGTCFREVEGSGTLLAKHFSQWGSSRRRSG